MKAHTAVGCLVTFLFCERGTAEGEERGVSGDSSREGISRQGSSVDSSLLPWQGAAYRTWWNDVFATSAPDLNDIYRVHLGNTIPFKMR